jgi:exosortase
VKPSIGNESVGVRNRELVSPSSALRGSVTQRDLELIGLVAASVFIWWRGIAATLKLAIDSDAHTHILLIVPISLALIYMRIREGRVAESSRGWPGLIFLAMAILLRGITAWDIDRLSTSAGLSVSILGLVLWWIGSVIFCLGGQFTRSLAFPLCFLFLVVPLPERAVNWVTESLQDQSAIGSELLFRAARVPVEREGLVLSIPTLDIEVARECSSIRSSTMLVVATLVLANLFLRSWWRQLLLAIISIPLGVAKNAIRIFTIIELGTRVDPGYLNGRLHHHGGVVFFGLALIVVAVLLWLLRIGEMRTNREPSDGGSG